MKMFDVGRPHKDRIGMVGNVISHVETIGTTWRVFAGAEGLIRWQGTFGARFTRV